MAQSSMTDDKIIEEFVNYEHNHNLGSEMGMVTYLHYKYTFDYTV